MELVAESSGVSAESLGHDRIPHTLSLSLGNSLNRKGILPIHVLPLTPSFLQDRIIARMDHLTVAAGTFLPSIYFPRMPVLLRTQAVNF